MSGEAKRKVVPITEAKGYGAIKEPYRREVGEGSAVVPVEFRRKDIVKQLQAVPIAFCFLNDYGQESATLILTLPEWACDLISNVGLNPSEEMKGPDGVV